MAHPEVEKVLLRERHKLVESANRIVQAIREDPLAAFNVRYSEDAGFQYEPILLDSEYMEAEIDLRAQGGPELSLSIDPEEAALGRLEVEALDFSVTAVGLFVALHLENTGWRAVELDLDPASGGDTPVILVDPATGNYMEPIASTLDGPVLPDVPRIGVLAFRLPTESGEELLLSLSPSWMRGERSGQDRVEFRISLDGMARGLAELREADPMELAMRERIEEVMDNVRDSIENPSAGCMLVPFLLLARVVAPM